MTPAFGALTYLTGLGWGLEHIRLEDPAAERIRAAADRGPVIYLLPRRSSLDHLALNAALRSRGLPLSVWAPRIHTGWSKPLGQYWREVRLRLGNLFSRGRVDPVASGWIRAALGTGHAATLFADDLGATDRTPMRWWTGSAPTTDRVLALLDTSANPLDPGAPDRGIQVVPVQIVWNRAPRSTKRAARFFAGDAHPSLLRRLWHLARGADGMIAVGEAIDLATLQQRVPRVRVPKVLRRIATRTLHREVKLIRGPVLLSHRAMKRRVIQTPPIRDLVARVAEAERIEPRIVQRRLSREYDRIAANFSWTMIQLLHILLRPLWTRVFSGVDVRPEDLEHIRQAMLDGSAILVPCHKSHFDYLLLSWVMYDNDLIVPHVVAGMNLAVWPLSTVLRGAGGFFIKRSFSGQSLFPPLFSRYLRELMRQEYPVEFFIEGGRTRSGKLLRPRPGVLGMVLDAASVRRRGREATLLPMAFAYEQVAEEGAYAHERRGRHKRPESLGQLVRASSVLRRRFGRVYLRVGAPIRCGPLVDGEDGRPRWADRPAGQTRRELEDLGAKIVHRIGTVVVLLPTSIVALGLLAHHRRAVHHRVLAARVDRLFALLRELGAPAAASLDRFDQAITSALDRFLDQGWVDALEHEGERIWSVIPEERLTLDFHKNQVLHYLAPAGLAACALRATPCPAALPQLQGHFDTLRHLWRREFVWDPDLSDADRLVGGLDDLEMHGAIRRDDAGAVVDVDPERIGEIYGLFRPLLEAYDAVLRHPDLPQGESVKPSRGSAPRPNAVLARAVLDAGAVQLASGAMTRPEALSMETLQNAVSALVEDDIVKEGPDGRLVVDAVAAAQPLARMDPMVRP